MRYRTDIDRGPTIYSPSGSDTYYDYVRSKDDHGVDCLVKGCIHSIKDELICAAKGCDLATIVRRAGLGDPTAVLPVDESMFGDIVGAPSSLADAEMRIIRAKGLFDSLPAELRRRYNNNPSEFMRSIEDGSYSKYLVQKAKQSDPTPSLSVEEIEELRKLVGGSNG